MLNSFLVVRAWRIGGEQVPDVARSAGGRHRQLRRQHRGEEPVHHFGEGDQGEAQPVALGLRGGHGDGDGEEREAGSEEEGDAGRYRQAAEAVAPKGRRFHVLRRLIANYWVFSCFSFGYVGVTVFRCG